MRGILVTGQSTGLPMYEEDIFFVRLSVVTVSSMWLQWEEGKQMKASVSIEHPPFLGAYMTKWSDAVRS